MCRLECDASRGMVIINGNRWIRRFEKNERETIRHQFAGSFLFFTFFALIHAIVLIAWRLTTQESEGQQFESTDVC